MLIKAWRLHPNVYIYIDVILYGMSSFVEADLLSRILAFFAAQPEENNA